MSEVRDTVRQKFGACLGNERAGRALEVCTFNVVREEAVARKIPRYWENRAFRRVYTDKARSLLFNLNNPETPGLKADLMSATGIEPFQRLVRMTHQEMHPTLWKPVFEQLERKARRGKMDEVPLEHVGMYQCARCRSWRTTFTLLQTRASDEPTTAFCMCHHCGKRWRMSA